MGAASVRFSSEPGRRFASGGRAAPPASVSAGHTDSVRTHIRRIIRFSGGEHRTPAGWCLRGRRGLPGTPEDGVVQRFRGDVRAVRPADRAKIRAHAKFREAVG